MLTVCRLSGSSQALERKAATKPMHPGYVELVAEVCGLSEKVGLHKTQGRLKAMVKLIRDS